MTIAPGHRVCRAYAIRCASAREPRVGRITHSLGRSGIQDWVRLQSLVFIIIIICDGYAMRTHTLTISTEHGALTERAGKYGPGKCRVRHSPEFVGGQFTELVELNLLGEHVQRHRGRSPQTAAALVIVQYGVERRPVPVEEVLVSQRVEVPHPPARVAQQRVRELIQRPQLGLEFHAAYLKHVAVIRDALTQL